MRRAQDRARSARSPERTERAARRSSITEREAGTFFKIKVF